MLQRSFRAYGLILTAALTLFLLSAGFQQRLSLDDLLWASPAGPESNTKIAESLYRQQLSTVRVLDRLPHSRTLGIAQKIYVIGLARRADRRAHMNKLMEAMDLDVVWHDALDLHDGLVTNILERVRWARAQSRIGHEKEVPDPQGLRFAWLPDVGSDAPVPPQAGVDMWFLPNGTPKGLKPLPPPPSPDTRPPVLRTAGEDILIPGEVITRAQVSCWYSHYQVLLDVARGDSEVAIVLEDDIDMEVSTTQLGVCAASAFKPTQSLRTVGPGKTPSSNVAAPSQRLGHCHARYVLPTRISSPALNLLLDRSLHVE